MTRYTPETAALLQTVAEATALREGPDGVVALLRAIHAGRSAKLRDVARAIHLPLPVASAVRRELENAGILERDHLVLTERGRAFVEQELHLLPPISAGCEVCAGSGVMAPDRDLLAQLTELLARHPSTDVTLDQSPCTPTTALRRAALMAEAGALDGKRIVILGDDDSISVALCVVHRWLTGAAPEVPITVLELDPRRVEFLTAIAASEGFPIVVVGHDLREPLPEAMRGRFDAFQTDPPYTAQGARLFLTRAREALVPGEFGYGMLSFGQRPPAEQHALLGLLHELGFAVRAIRPGFNEYLGAAVLGNTGQLLELVAAAEPAAAAFGTWSGPLYSHDVNPRERRYRCIACREVWTLGRDGVPATIEALKQATCPACGATSFTRLSSRD